MICVKNIILYLLLNYLICSCYTNETRNLKHHETNNEKDLRQMSSVPHKLKEGNNNNSSPVVEIAIKIGKIHGWNKKKYKKDSNNNNLTITREFKENKRNDDKKKINPKMKTEVNFRKNERRYNNKTLSLLLLLPSDTQMYRKKYNKLKEDKSENGTRRHKLENKEHNTLKPTYNKIALLQTNVTSEKITNRTKKRNNNNQTTEIMIANGIEKIKSSTQLQTLSQKLNTATTFIQDKTMPVTKKSFEKDERIKLPNKITNRTESTLINKTKEKESSVATKSLITTPVITTIARRSIHQNNSTIKTFGKTNEIQTSKLAIATSTPKNLYPVLRSFTHIKAKPKRIKNIISRTAKNTRAKAATRTFNPKHILRDRESIGVNPYAVFVKKMSPYSIKEIMEEIAKENDQDIDMNVEVVARTALYRDIVLVKISQRSDSYERYYRRGESAERYAPEVPVKKVIFIVHALNAAFINNVPALRLLNEFKILLYFYMRHLNLFDIYIMPLANPDGTEISMKMYNSWCKNNSPQKWCAGVFLDRNFDVAWDQDANINPCSILYPGPSPFSEVETRAVRDILHQHSSKIVAFINVHPSIWIGTPRGEAVLFPRGYTDVSNDDDKYYDLKGEFEEAVRNVSLREIPVQMMSLYNFYGKVTGTSVDYAAQVYGIPYSLEFVMGAYAVPFNNLLYEKYVLRDIWHKIIDVVFLNIFKNINANQNDRL